MRLWLKECGKVLSTIPYWVCIAAIALMYVTQYQEDNQLISQPIPNQASYGMHYVENPEIIMPAAVNELVYEVIRNQYISYPIGFYKEVVLNERKQAEIVEQLNMLVDREFNLIDAEQIGATLQLADTVTYDHFKKVMKQVDKLIGGGSKYSESYLLKNFGHVEMTYEDAFASYNAIMQKDKISGAYARVFVDYIGIMLGILPVFIAVALSLKDSKKGIQEVIYTRKISSVRLVLTRYMAIIIMIIIPILLVACYETMHLQSLYDVVNYDQFAFVKYSLGWLMPTVLVVTALGMLLTEWTGTAIAIIVQGVWWFVSMFMGIAQIDGGYGRFVLSPRHNKLGNTELYLEQFNSLVMNRGFYTIFAFLLLGCTVWIYEKKRRGMHSVKEWVIQKRANYKNEY